MWPFRPSNVPRADLVDWIHDTTAWFLRHSGGVEALRQRPLVTPTEDYFRIDDLHADHTSAVDLFVQTQKLAGLSERRFIVEQHEHIPDTTELMPGIAFGDGAPRASALGTFSKEPSEEAVITYDPSLVDDAENLVATFAHELAHATIEQFREDIPGGQKNHEYATDLAAVMMGFGIFLANSSFRFAQYQDMNTQGWDTSRSGYLNEVDLSYALSLFVVLRGEPLDDALWHLRPNPKVYAKTAYKYIRKKEMTAVETLLSGGIRN